MMGPPVAGRDYPSSLLEPGFWFRSEADCLDYLDWLRWPDGFVCPWCAGVGDWSDSAGMHRCSDCGRRISVTAGTIFHRTRTQMPVWFQAAWLMSVSKQGLSAQNLMRTTGLGSYQTAWAMLHRFRTVMGSAGHEMLSGHVEMDETFVGGKRKPGLRGRGAAGKTLVAGAIERRGRGFGRARLHIIPNASTASLAEFIKAQVTPGSTLVTNGLQAYQRATTISGVHHEPHNVAASGAPAHVSLPGVHRLFALFKRVLEGTYQGSAQPEHLQSYLDEFIFRFNRRTSHDRGLLFLRLLQAATAGEPASYDSIPVIHRKPDPSHHERSASRGLSTAGKADPGNRPWRSP